MKCPYLVGSVALFFLAACETNPSINTEGRVCVAPISGSARTYLRNNATEIIGDVLERSVFILRDSVTDTAVVARGSQSGRCEAGQRALTGEEWREEIATQSARNLQNGQSCAFSQVGASNQQMQDVIYDITLSGLGGAAYSGIDGDYALNVASDCELAEPFVRGYLSHRQITGAVAVP